MASRSECSPRPPAFEAGIPSRDVCEMPLFRAARHTRPLWKDSTMSWSNKVFANTSFVLKLQGKMLGRIEAKFDRDGFKCSRFEDRHFCSRSKRSNSPFSFATPQRVERWCSEIYPPGTGAVSNKRNSMTVKQQDLWVLNPKASAMLGRFVWRSIRHERRSRR
jgi:hypothetical protein